MTTAEKISYLKIEKFCHFPPTRVGSVFTKQQQLSNLSKNNTKQEEGNTKSRTRKRIDGGNFVVAFFVCRMTMTVKKANANISLGIKVIFFIHNEIVASFQQLKQQLSASR